MNRENTASTGLSFGSILFFIFLVMKLTHYIDWSWWWVTAPLWLPITVVLAIFGAIGLGWLIIVMVSTICIAIFDGKK